VNEHGTEYQCDSHRNEVVHRLDTHQDGSLTVTDHYQDDGSARVVVVAVAVVHVPQFAHYQ